MSQVDGCVFAVTEEETRTPQLADEHAAALADQFIKDMQFFCRCERRLAAS